MSSDELANCKAELHKVTEILNSKPESEHFLKQKKILEERIRKLEPSKPKAKPQKVEEPPKEAPKTAPEESEKSTEVEEKSE